MKAIDQCFLKKLFDDKIKCGWYDGQMIVLYSTLACTHTQTHKLPTLLSHSHDSRIFKIAIFLSAMTHCFYDIPACLGHLLFPQCSLL